MSIEFRPHEYQKECIRRIITTPKVGLFLDMGLGKTVTTLTALMDLKFNRFKVNKVLVIAPKKVAEGTWSKEKDKWNHTKSLRVSLVLGTEKQRFEALQQLADIYIINRENVAWLVGALGDNWPFDTVVIDESSSFKNPKAKRFKALASVIGRTRRVIELTGTPSPNGIMDLWSQVYLLDQGKRLERSFTGYRDRYFYPGARNGYVVYEYKPKPGSYEAITEKISDICISMKAEDYLSLPDLIEQEVPVVLDKKASRVYAEMERDLILELDGDDIPALSAAALTNKLLQIANGAVYDETRGVHEVHPCKIEAFTELIEALDGNSVLVFYNFQHDRDRILKALSKLKLRVRELKTVEDQDQWNKGNVDVLLAHPASSAYGLNLQEGGNHIIWFGLTWNYELYVQANKRLHRQGQKDKVFIHHLVAQGTRDEDVMKALSKKEDAQNYIMSSLKARIREVRGERK